MERGSGALRGARLADRTIVIGVGCRDAAKGAIGWGDPGSAIGRAYLQGGGSPITGQLPRGRARQAITVRVGWPFTRVAQVRSAAERRVVPAIAARLALLELTALALKLSLRTAAQGIAAAVGE